MVAPGAWRATFSSSASQSTTNARTPLRTAVATSRSFLIVFPYDSVAGSMPTSRQRAISPGLATLQGYAYDAKVRAARLARLVWNDPTFAEALEQQAADLKRRFNRDFWVEDG